MVSTTPELLDLRQYLSPDVAERLAHGPLDQFRLYPWQACALMRVIGSGGNLVYCAPTSGGKSLVADVLLLRNLMATGRPGMVVLPYVALCEEKAARLERVMDTLPGALRVKRFFGTESSRTILDSDTGCLVCTIEKANTLVNRMIEEGVLHQLGTGKLLVHVIFEDSLAGQFYAYLD